MSNSSRIVNSTKNISAGMIAQGLQMVLGFVSRTIFIKYLAVEYLGINSLFTNILSMLSLAEMGLGSAFVYALYKPLADKDYITLASIINYYKKMYWYVGTFIFVAGIALIPFLQYIIPQKPSSIVEDIRLIYALFLFNSASTYFFSYKISMLDADQKISVFTLNSIKFLLFQNILQILVLVFFQNFILYLLVQTVSNFLSNYYISKIVDKRYPFLVEHKKEVIDSGLKSKIISNTKSTFLVKIGGILVNSTDNIIINYFVGLAILGKFSNYVMLISMITSMAVLFFSNIKSSITNIIFTEAKEVQINTFQSFNFLTFWVYGLCSVMLFFLLNDFIIFWIGNNYVLEQKIILIAVINFFMLGMQNTFWIFKSGFGFFKYGRYIVLFTALINLILSFLLGYYYGIFGVLLATAIARLCTNFWYDPYVVLKLGLNQNPMLYLSKFFKYIVVLVVSALFIYYITLYINFTPLLNLILKGIICISIVNAVLIITFYKAPEFKKIVLLGRYTLNMIISKLK